MTILWVLMLAPEPGRHYFWRCVIPKWRRFWVDLMKLIFLSTCCDLGRGHLGHHSQLRSRGPLPLLPTQKSYLFAALQCLAFEHLECSLKWSFWNQSFICWWNPFWTTTFYSNRFSYLWLLKGQQKTRMVLSNSPLQKLNIGHQFHNSGIDNQQIKCFPPHLFI